MALVRPTDGRRISEPCTFTEMWAVIAGGGGEETGEIDGRWSNLRVGRMDIEDVVDSGAGGESGSIEGRRMSLRLGFTRVEATGNSSDSGIDAADTWLVSVTDPVCQLTAPLMTQESPRIHTKTVLLNKC